MSDGPPGGGWYPDPTGRFGWRYWTGSSWSEWVASAGRTYTDREPVTTDLAHITYAKRFVEELGARGVIDRQALATATGELTRREAVIRRGPVSPAAPGPEAPVLPTRPARPTSAGPSPAPPQPRPVLPPTHYRPPSRPTLRAPSHRAPSPRAPAPAHHGPERPPVVPALARMLRHSWGRLRDAVVSDLAVYGLAYLGVVLLFAGVFGLLAFSFSDVRRSLRPITEIAIPVATFGSAWLLSRHGPRLVSRMLVLLGGLLLPVVVIASFVDGASVPPDLTGVALVLATASACFVLAGAYALIAARDESSPLRFLVGPALWLGVAMAGQAAQRVIPSGNRIVRPAPWQMAIVSVAITATVALGRRMRARLRTATEWAAVPGVGVVLVLLALCSSARAWPSAPTLVGGAAALVTTEMLSGLVDRRVAALVHVAIVAGAFTASAPDWGTAWAGAAAAASFVLLAEWEGYRRPSPVASIATMTGAGVGLAAAAYRPWPAFAAFAGVAVWAHVRRLLPAAWCPGKRWMTTAAALLPAGAAAGLLFAVPIRDAALALAAATLLVAVGVRLLHAVDDALWRWWPPACAVAVAGIAIGARIPAVDVATVLALTTVTLAIGLRWPTARAWAAGASALATVGYVLAALDVAPRITGAEVYAVAGMVLVLVGTARWWVVSAHLALIGMLVSAAALVAAEGAAWFPALGAFTLGWAVTVAAEEARTAPVIELVVRTVARGRATFERGVRMLPPVVAVVSFVALAAVAADRWHVVSADNAWSAVVVSVTALAYALLGRALGHRPTARVLAPAAFWFALLAAVGAGAERVAVVTLTLGIATVVAIDSPRRRTPYVWCAWAMSGALAVVVARQVGLVGTAWYPALVVWGAVLTIGSLAGDDVRAGRRRPAEWLRTSWARAPATLGAVGFSVGLAAEFTQRATAFGWWSLAGAAITAVVAWQLHAGALTTVSWSLACVAYGALAPWRPVQHPWSLVPAAAVLVAASAALAVRPRPRGWWWQRWDLAPLGVAYAVAAAALAATGTAGSVPATYSSTGGLALAIAAWRRQPAWALAANALFLIAAVDAGPGWTALVCGAVAAEAWAAATRTRDATRALLQLAGAAALSAAGIELGVFAGLSATASTVAAALVGGGVLAVSAAAARWAQLREDWAATWAAPAFIALSASAAALFDGRTSHLTPGLAVAGGFVLATGAAALAAMPLRQGWLRDSTAVLAATAGGALLYGVQAGPGELAVCTAGGGLAATFAAIVIETRVPRSRWLRPSALFAAIAAAGSLFIAGTGQPGPGARMLVCAALAVEAWGVAERVQGWQRTALQSCGAAAFGAAAVEFGLWTALTADEAVVVAAISAGVVLVLVAAAARWVSLHQDWTATWAGTAFLALSASAMALFGGRTSHLAPGLAVAGGFVLATGAAALAAMPLRQGWLRDSTAVLAATAGGALLYGVQASAAELAVCAGGGALAATLAAIAIDTRAPRSGWLRPSALFALIATAASLLAVRSGEAGPGAAALVCAVITVEAWSAAWRVQGWVRGLLQGCGAAAFGAAAVEVGLWSALTADEWVVAGAIAGGVAVAVTAAAARRARLAGDWTLTWGGTALVGLCAGAVALFDGRTSHLAPGLAVAGGFVLATGATGSTAIPLRQGWMRDATSVFAATAGAALLYAVQASPAQLVATTSGAALALTLATGLVRIHNDGTPWARPLISLSGISTVVALASAASQLPRRDLLAGALLAAGAQSAAAGMVFDRVEAVVASPVLWCASWFTFATEALTGNPEWYTVPVGLTLLAIDELERQHERLRGHRPATPPTVALEYVAMAFLVASPLAQEVSVSLACGLLAIGFGCVLAVWGVATHVRRRLYFGTGVIFTAALLIVAVPVARAVPTWHGPALWMALGVVGLVAMAVAAVLEQSHGRVRHAVDHFGQLTRHWE